MASVNCKVREDGEDHIRDEIVNSDLECGAGKA
jgi:hypothetical protein